MPCQQYGVCAHCEALSNYIRLKALLQHKKSPASDLRGGLFNAAENALLDDFQRWPAGFWPVLPLAEKRGALSGWRRAQGPARPQRDHCPGHSHARLNGLTL